MATATAAMAAGVAATPQQGARCFPRNVLSVAKTPRYRSSLAAIDRYTVLTAIAESNPPDKRVQLAKDRPDAKVSGLFLFPIAAARPPLLIALPSGPHDF